MNDHKQTIFNKATLVLAQANYVNGVVELRDTDAEFLPSICSLIDNASANAGISTSTAHSQVVDANKISVSIPGDEIGKVMKKLHELHHQPTDATVLEESNASKLMNYIEKLKSDCNESSTAPVALEDKSPQISLSADFVGPMPSEEENLGIAAVAA